MQKAINFHLRDNSGSTLLLAVLVMLALSAVAVITAQLATTNLETAVSVQHHKANFFKTDADIEIFNTILIDTVNDREPDANMSADVDVRNPTYYFNANTGPVCPTGRDNADVILSGLGATVDLNFKNETFITISVREQLNPGNSLLIAEGYEGTGESLAGGGLIRTYTSRALGIGKNNSQTRLTTQYQYIP